jgi:uncharacterized protein
MLIRFIVENFLCFNDEAEFSMVAAKGRILKDHVISGKNARDVSLLRTAVIYGANASGKSNLIKSMEFARSLIVKGTPAGEQIPVTKFKLDLKASKRPSRFQFEFKCKDKVYSYGFSLDADCIHEEWLYDRSTPTEKLLFERKSIIGEKTQVTFGKLNYKEDKDEQLLIFTGLGTRPEQLFLTETFQRNTGYFNDIYEWFQKKLIFIFPESAFGGIEFFLKENETLSNEFKKYLLMFDTGISDIITEEYDLEKDRTDIPKEIITNIQKDLKEKDIKALIRSENNSRYALFKNGAEQIKALKLLSKHKIKGTNKEEHFEIKEESDGTQRLIDILPALMTLQSFETVIIIDEIDRRLHPHITKKILEIFLSFKSKSQLIVTTHETSLLDLKLLRKDEIWFVEKNKDGESSVYSLEEYKPRYDKDIRKGYLLGRFGAIPFLRGKKGLGW